MYSKASRLSTLTFLKTQRVVWKLTKSPKSWKKVISHVSCSQSNSLMADIYSGWENSLISAGFMLTAGSKANRTVLMQSHIVWVSRINKINGLGCSVHNCWSLCSKLHHFKWQDHNANEKYGCSSSATLAASERWPFGLDFPFIAIYIWEPWRIQCISIFVQNVKFPLASKWMLSFYPRIIRHLNCAPAPSSTQPQISLKEKMESQGLCEIRLFRAVSVRQMCHSGSYSCWCAMWRLGDRTDGGTLRGDAAVWSVKTPFWLKIQAESQIRFASVTLIQFSWQSKQYIMYRSAWCLSTVKCSWR